MASSILSGYRRKNELTSKEQIGNAYLLFFCVDKIGG